MALKSEHSGFSGSVRIRRLSAVAMTAMEAHGKRLDRKGASRRVVDASPLTTTGLDLVDLYERHIEGAATHKSSTKALHVLVQFPTELVDGEKPEIMLDLARRFATTVFGAAAIFSDRVDRDEKSRHVVDLFVAPKYEKTTKHSSKLAVSTSKHLKDLAAKYGRGPTLRGQGQALQDAWAEFLLAQGYDKTKRGAPKKQPGDDRLEPEELEAERLDDLKSSLMGALEPPTRLDFLNPDRWFQNQRARIEQAAAPLLNAATQTAKETLLRKKAEKAEEHGRKLFQRANRANADAQARLREIEENAERLAEVRANEARQLMRKESEAAMDNLRWNLGGRIAALETQIAGLSSELKAENAKLAGAEERANQAEIVAATTQAELKSVKAELSQLKNFMASMRETLKRILGAGFEAARQLINGDWAKNPKNPNRQNETASRSNYHSSGPSQ